MEALNHCGRLNFNCVTTVGLEQLVTKNNDETGSLVVDTSWDSSTILMSRLKWNLI